MGDLSIRITRKVYRKGNTLALESVALDVTPGQFVALVGPSGAGKTSLMNIVAGLDPHFDGEVIRPNEMSPVGMVFQTPRLMPWLTVLDNLRLVLGPNADQGADRGANLDNAHRLLTELGLEEFIHAYPRQLSGGMQRRVALGRAFVVRPRLLLMDEPFQSLDDPLAWRLREQLQTMWLRDKPTVLYITHNLDEALFLADRVVFFSARPGRIILDEPISTAQPRAMHAEGMAQAITQAISQARAELLARHPQLLSGHVSSANQTTDDGDSSVQLKADQEARCT